MKKATGTTALLGPVEVANRQEESSELGVGIRGMVALQLPIAEVEQTGVGDHEGRPSMGIRCLAITYTGSSLVACQVCNR